MQLTHTEFSPKWTEGQLTRSDPHRVKTKISDDINSLKIGQVVVKGASTKHAKLPQEDFTYDDFLGVVIHAIGINEKKIGTGEVEIEPSQPFTVLDKGSVAIKVSADVFDGGTVYFNHTEGASPIHTFRGDADSGKASKIPARFMDSGIAGDLVEIEINSDLAIGDA